MSKETLQKAVNLAGGQTRLAAGVRARMPVGSKVGQVHVWGWLNDLKSACPPAEYVLPICDTVAWKITPHELRPDLYPHPSDGMPKVSHATTAQPQKEAA